MDIETTLVPIRQVYANGNFRIYDCAPNNNPDIQLNSRGTISIKGTIQRLDLDVEHKSVIRLAEVHPEYGASYWCSSIYQDIPETTEGQKDYLATVMTDLQLQETIKVYGEDTDIIELIKNKTFDYNKVFGFGPIVFERIYQKVMETLEYKEILSKFGKYGITYKTILELAEELGGTRQLAIQKLEDDPYILCKYVSGWGFKRTDIVAKKMGIKHNDPRRIREGIKYTIEENQKQGHTWMPRKDLLLSACDILQLDEELISNEVDKTDGLKIIPSSNDSNEDRYKDKIALQNTYNAEYKIAKKLKELLKNNIELEFDVEDFINRMEEKYGFILTDEQRSFIHMIKKNRVGLLVGNAGSGKTFLQKLFLDLMQELKLTYTFLSPSAQAAKVTKKYTGVGASTIHKKIGWGRDKKSQMMISVDEQVVIVDESSMTDVFILNILLSKLNNPEVRVLFVGDNFQLLSISAGNILHDMIHSKVVPMTMLSQVFRQEDAGILEVASKIRAGEQFLPDNFSGKKVFGKDMIIHCINQAEMEKGYKHYYKSYLNKYNPEDIMILSPTKKGNLGTISINSYVQSVINPPDGDKKEYPYGNICLFRTGDYIMNTVNMYSIFDYDDNSIDLVNGDKGVLVDVVRDAEENLEKRRHEFLDNDAFEEEASKERNRNGLVVDYNDIGNVRMNFNDVSQLLHSWCITMHKSQGDAADAVLIVADRSHKFQLTSNLLYTAVTRAKKKCILLTQAETLNYAIRRKESFRRKTFLCDLLSSDSMNEAIESV